MIDALQVTHRLWPFIFMGSIWAVLYLSKKRIDEVEERLGHIERLLEARLDGLVILKKGKAPIIDTASGGTLAYIDFAKYEITSAKPEEAK